MNGLLNEKLIVYLSSCEETKVKVDNEMKRLKLGITIDKLIFIRLIINNNICYENLFKFNDKDMDMGNNLDIIKLLCRLIKDNQYYFYYNEKKSELYFQYTHISKIINLSLDLKL